MTKQHRTSTNTHVTYYKICEVTNKKYEVTITLGQEARWHGGEHIQKVCPELNPDQREFLISSLTPSEWDFAMKTDNEDNSSDKFMSTSKKKEEDNSVTAITVILTDESPDLIEIIKKLTEFKCRAAIISKIASSNIQDIQDFINRVRSN